MAPHLGNHCHVFTLYMCETSDDSEGAKLYDLGRLVQVKSLGAAHLLQYSIIRLSVFSKSPIELGFLKNP